MQAEAILTLLNSFSLTTFSPSGKLVQIEHALAAVSQGATSLGIKGECLALSLTSRHFSHLTRRIGSLHSIQCHRHRDGKAATFSLGRRLIPRKSLSCLPQHRHRLLRHGSGFQSARSQSEKVGTGLLEDLWRISADKGARAGGGYNHARCDTERVGTRIVAFLAYIGRKGKEYEKLTYSVTPTSQWCSSIWCFAARGWVRQRSRPIIVPG